MGNKILLAGASLQCGNRGVNALTRGTITALLDKYGNIEIKILSCAINNQITNTMEINNKVISVEEIPYGLRSGFFICLASLFNRRVAEIFLEKLFKGYSDLYHEINNADIIMDISAGDSFSDIYGFKRLLINSVIKLSAIKMKKKIILLPQTMGPFKGFLSKRIARYITRNVTFNFVRDLISYNVLHNELGVEKAKIRYIPDMAFYMYPDNRITANEIIPYDKGDNEEIIGLNISALLYNGGYTQNNAFGFIVNYNDLIGNIIDYFIKIGRTRILLVPHVICEDMVEDDLRVCKKIYAQLHKKYKNRIYTIDKPYREDELKQIIGQCDFFIGGRMHACIGAVSMRVPTVPIAYSRKFIGIWNELGLGDCVADPRYNSTEQILETIETNYNRRKEVKKILETKLENVRNDILNMFELVENLSNGVAKFGQH